MSVHVVSLLWAIDSFLLTSADMLIMWHLQIRMDLHSFGTDAIIVNDPASGQVTAITPSNGSCSAFSGGRANSWLTQDDNSTLISTAELLRFTKDSNIQYLPGLADVRSVCQQRRHIFEALFSPAIETVKLKLPAEVLNVKLQEQSCMASLWNSRPSRTLPRNALRADAETRPLCQIRTARQRFP